MLQGAIHYRSRDGCGNGPRVPRGQKVVALAQCLSANWTPVVVSFALCGVLTVEGGKYIPHAIFMFFDELPPEARMVVWNWLRG